MKNNNDIFNRIWNDATKYGIAFISSNGGTGKTTYFKFRLLANALRHDIPFFVYVRYKNQMENMAQSFLDIKDSYSNRQKSKINRCKILKENENFIYIVEAETGRKLIQFVNINNQAYYKQFGNVIHAKFALFDEILAENGDYCPDEINKFNRLNLTMARSNDFFVIGLYNNTKPYFDYFKYYKAINYTTHTSKSGARFIYFIANQWQLGNKQFSPHSIQQIMKNTDYANVYNNNEFTQYPLFYKNENLKDTRILFKIEIEGQLFKLREKNNIFYLDNTKALKQSNHLIFSVDNPNKTTYNQLPAEMGQQIRELIDTNRLKTNNINDTIFCEILNQIL